MKKLILFLSVIASVMLATGCSKDDDNDSKTNTTPTNKDTVAHPDSVTFTVVMLFQNAGTNKDVSYILEEWPWGTYNIVRFEDGSTNLPRYEDKYYTQILKYKYQDGFLHAFKPKWHVIEANGDTSGYETFNPLAINNLTYNQIDSVSVFVYE